MCGIVGILRRDGDAVDASPLDAMLDRIRHRGPDDRGTWVDTDLALGHVRLSVIDLTTRAHQPMLTADGDGVLVYNGEVYNFRLLRTELEAEGATFTSDGDTEVVLQALHRWGPRKAIPRFDGMFALAYRDLRDGSLWLARDRLGIKSLAYTVRGETLILCSEVKGLLAHPDVSARIDRGRVDYHLIYGRVDSRDFPFEGVHALDPGTIHRVRRDEVEVARYFDLRKEVDPGRVVDARGLALEDAVRATRRALTESVRMHLISDAPLAVMCSGGVDSSLVTALARDVRPDVEAYVADVGGEVSEADQARRAAEHLGVPLRRIDVGRETFLRLWPEAIWHHDAPSSHPSDPPLLAVARRCREDGIKVLLTGEGADELFGGYRWYWYTRRRWRRARLRSRLPGALGAPWRERWRHLQRLAYHGADFEDDALRRRLTAAVAPYLESRREALFEHLAPIEPPEDRAAFAHQLDDLHHHLGWILHRHDRIAMGASIEARVPFLENDLIDLGLHLPVPLKLHRGTTKRTLKALAMERLPREIVYAKKKGFPVPKTHWRGTEVLLHRGGFVPELLRWGREETDRILAHTAADSQFLYHLVSLEIWGRLFFRGETRGEIGERLLGV